MRQIPCCSNHNIKDGQQTRRQHAGNTQNAYLVEVQLALGVVPPDVGHHRRAAGVIQLQVMCAIWIHSCHRLGTMEQFMEIKDRRNPKAHKHCRLP